MRKRLMFINAKVNTFKNFETLDNKNEIIERRQKGIIFINFFLVNLKKRSRFYKIELKLFKN